MDNDRSSQNVWRQEAQDVVKVLELAGGAVNALFVSSRGVGQSVWLPGLTF